MLVRAVDAILGTHKIKEEGHATNSRISMRPAPFGAGLLETKARIASGVCRRARDVGPWAARPAGPIVNKEVIEMLILVAQASKHGATRGIAERIAERLAAARREALMPRLRDVVTAEAST